MLSTHTDAPESYAEVTYRKFVEGRNMSLTCIFDGYPTPTVTWIHNVTIELNNSDPQINISIGDGFSTLQISSVQVDDGGLYECQHSNSLGVHVSSITVFILSECIPYKCLIPGWPLLPPRGHLATGTCIEVFHDIKQKLSVIDAKDFNCLLQSRWLDGQDKLNENRGRWP